MQVDKTGLTISLVGLTISSVCRSTWARAAFALGLGGNRLEDGLVPDSEVRQDCLEHRGLRARARLSATKELACRWHWAGGVIISLVTCASARSWFSAQSTSMS